MKPLRYTLIALAAACGFANAQTATTTPVGYVTLPAAPADSDTYISIPLDRSVEFAGVLAANPAGDVLTIAGSLGDLTTVPHTLKITNGTGAGIIALITAYDDATDAVTIAVPSGDSLAGVVAGDKVEINKAWTISSLLGSPSAGTALLGTSTASGLNPAADLIYEFDGTNWIDTNSFEVADSVALFPNESWIIRTGATPIPGIVVTGTVPVADSRVALTALAGGTDNPVTFFGAVGEVIGTSGLAAVAEPGDTLLGVDNTATGINKAASTIIEFDGTSWIDTNSFEDVSSTFKIESGVGYLIRLVGNTPRTVVWKNQPDYVPTL